MKNLYILIAVFTVSFAFAQQNPNKRTTFPELEKVENNQSEFSMILNYELAQADTNAIVADITNVLGEPMGTKPVWSSAKSKEENYTVKVLNGGVFVRASDYTSAQNTKALMETLQTALQEFRK